MSDDEHISLHSFNANDSHNHEDDIDQFYKDLSLQFYGEDKKKKISLLMSGSTQVFAPSHLKETSKPSRDTLPDVKKGVAFVTPKSSRPGSPRNCRLNGPKKLISGSPPSGRTL